MNNPLLTKEIKFIPAWDKRHKDPTKNYGIHCMDIVFILKGPKGAVVFTIFTGWYLPQNNVPNAKGQGADISYHSFTPIFEDHSCNAHCDYINAPCYSDGTGFGAIRLFNDFVTHGEDVVWKELENWYNRKLQ